ncbi:MAG: hypothetical protein ACLSWY_09445 [Ruthenibacterium lactatiformans]
MVRCNCTSDLDAWVRVLGEWPDRRCEAGKAASLTCSIKRR